MTSFYIILNARPICWTLLLKRIILDCVHINKFFIFNVKENWIIRYSGNKKHYKLHITDPSQKPGKSQKIIINFFWLI